MSDNAKLQEEQERIAKLIAERKEKKRIEEEREEIEREKQRREAGKKYQETLEQINTTKAALEIEKQKKEKQAQLEYDKKLKEQLRLEKEARRQEEEQRKKNAENPNPLSTSGTATTTPSPLSSSKPRTTLKVRLLNGTTVVEEFDNSQTLKSVQDAIKQKYLSDLPVPFHFRQLFPNTIYNTEELVNSTLKDLGLVPNASLVVTTAPDELQSQGTQTKPRGTVTSNNNTNPLIALWVYITSLVWWFLGFNTDPASPNPNPNESTLSGAPVQPTGPRRFVQRGIVNHVHTEKQYLDCLDTQDLVVVDFSAVWCGPCKKIAPLVETLAKENKGVVFIHLDIDMFRGTPHTEGVNSVPTFKFFKNKKLVASFSGADSVSLINNVSKYK